MKKKTITLITIILLCSYLLSACGMIGNDEPDITLAERPTPTPVVETGASESETEQPTDDPTTEPEQPTELDAIFNLLDIVGLWEHHPTEGTDIAYADWLTFTIEIRNDYTFTWSAYGALSGSLTYIGNYSFVAANLVASSEGQTWYPEEDEVTISYDPDSGLLSFTRVFNYPEGSTPDSLIMCFTKSGRYPCRCSC